MRNIKHHRLASAVFILGMFPGGGISPLEIDNSPPPGNFRNIEASGYGRARRSLETAL